MPRMTIPSRVKTMPRPILRPRLRFFLPPFLPLPSLPPESASPLASRLEAGPLRSPRLRGSGPPPPRAFAGVRGAGSLDAGPGPMMSSQFIVPLLSATSSAFQRTWIRLA